MSTPDWGELTWKYFLLVKEHRCWVALTTEELSLQAVSWSRTSGDIRSLSLNRVAGSPAPDFKEHLTEWVVSAATATHLPVRRSTHTRTKGRVSVRPHLLSPTDLSLVRRRSTLPGRKTTQPFHRYSHAGESALPSRCITSWAVSLSLPPVHPRELTHKQPRQGLNLDTLSDAFQT